MNRLTDETSPYLRQHADNPVDWYPWGEEAFAKARAEDKPVLLSVGYSSCHWCHVMAHESFEDPAIAAVMNERFVNVKVDREERPDVDAIYMQAVQALAGRGGWPMTVFLDPDGRPFFGGTYFPSTDRAGMPGFVRVMEAVDEAWHERRDDLAEQATTLTRAISQQHELALGDGATAVDAAVLDAAVERANGQFDPRFGGFGAAPKFPQAMTLTFLLASLVRAPSPATLETVTVSLDAMASGGIHDQVGGGFHRYSVDAYWLVPHFEKMLYDQALLLRAYVHGWLVTGEARHRRIAEEIVAYVLRDLRQPEGGFSSAEDADSEGVEGKFYCWSLAELHEVCGDDADEVISFYGATEQGNFEDPHTGFRGNILQVVHRGEEPPPAVARARPKLLAARARRVRPGLDDKVLLGWNALFLDALAEAAFVFDRDDWMVAARANAEFLVTRLRGPDGRLQRSWQGGRSHLRAYAEDHAALLEALLTLAELDDVAWLVPAREVARALVDRYADDDNGGFFTTADDAETLIVRPKDFEDNATPSENSLAAHALLRLAALTGDDDARARATAWIGRIAPVVGEHPTAFAYLLRAVDRLVAPPLEIAVVGRPDDSARRELVAELRGRHLPTAVRVIASPGAGAELTPLLEGRADGDAATAYVCQQYACRLPVTGRDELAAEIDAVLGTAGAGR